MAYIKNVGGNMFVEIKDTDLTVAGKYNEKSGTIFQQGSKSLEINSSERIHSDGTLIAKVNDDPILESIIFTQDLEKGYEEPNLGYNRGFGYGVEYKFKAKFKNNNPSNAVVKWFITFIDTSVEPKVKRYSDDLATGQTFSFKFLNIDLCGRNVSICAYTQNRENFVRKQIFSLYRFRHFNKQTFEKELIGRSKNPILFDQSSTSLCGTAAFMYFFAKNKPNLFINIYMYFFRTGILMTNSGRYEAKDKNIYLMYPESKNYPRINYTNGTVYRYMPIVDWVILAGTRALYESSYKGGDQKIEAINWPWYMKELINDLYYPSYHEVFSRTDTDDYELMMKINSEMSSGSNIIILIEASIISKNLGNIHYPNHWICVVEPLKFNNNKNELTMTYVTWGGKYTLTIKQDNFRKKLFEVIAFR